MFFIPSFKNLQTIFDNIKNKKKFVKELPKAPSYPYNYSNPKSYYGNPIINDDMRNINSDDMRNRSVDDMLNPLNALSPLNPISPFSLWNNSESILHEDSGITQQSNDDFGGFGGGDGGGAGASGSWESPSSNDSSSYDSSSNDYSSGSDYSSDSSSYSDSSSSNNDF